MPFMCILCVLRAIGEARGNVCVTSSLLKKARESVFPHHHHSQLLYVDSLTHPPHSQEESKVLSDPAISARFLRRAKLRMPWRFFPDHPAYTPDMVEDLESELRDQGVAKGSPYFADVAYNRL